MLRVIETSSEKEKRRTKQGMTVRRRYEKVIRALTGFTASTLFCIASGIGTTEAVVSMSVDGIDPQTLVLFFVSYALFLSLFVTTWMKEGLASPFHVGLAERLRNDRGELVFDTVSIIVFAVFAPACMIATCAYIASRSDVVGSADYIFLIRALFCLTYSIVLFFSWCGASCIMGKGNLLQTGLTAEELDLSWRTDHEAISNAMMRRSDSGRSDVE